MLNIRKQPSNLPRSNANWRNTAILAISLFLPVTTSGEVVVLRNGNVFQGEVRQQEHQVVVQTKHSQVSFTRDTVDFVAHDLPAAYRKRASRISDKNERSREELIHWCLQHDLLTQAKTQLTLLERQFPESRRLAAWRRQIDRREQIPLRGTVLPAKLPNHPDIQRARDLETVLSKETQFHFVRHVQPILINGCALANCHGRGAKNDFSLLTGRAPLPRRYTQRNQGAVLRQIGDVPPEHSLLWISANEAHGGVKRAPLSDSELERLLEWISMAHQDTTGLQHQGEVKVARKSPERDPFDPAEFNALPR